jgi:alpha-glucosidase
VDGDAADGRWWQSTSVYQIYPRSFADGDGDGIGDLAGIVSRLDHCVELGVETVWVSPFFASPQRDFGYDISDYCDVASEYGSVADAEALIGAAHDRGLRVVFDLVLNHTSDEHPWFVESRASRSGPKADWYVWRDGTGPGGRRPPNNWRCAMEVATAWQWCDERQQWYLASFLPFQPDLNWRNPDVKAAMFDAVRFWLDRGVDGFRLDIFGSIMKDPQFRPNPLRPSMQNGLPRLYARVHTENTDDTIALARELRAVCDAYPGDERMLVGEVFGDPATLRRYLVDGSEADVEPDGLHLVFLFDMLSLKFSASWFRRIVEDNERLYPWPLAPTYVIENHDRSRSIDRLGGDRERARVVAAVLCCLRGVPFVYMGQEIGMRNTEIPLDEAQDPVAHRYFDWIPEAVARRLPERVNRDEMRTPMLWDASPHAGFCPDDVEPWVRIEPGHVFTNVATQHDDPESLLNVYRRFLHLRRDEAALRTGALEILDVGDDDVFAFVRTPGVTGTGVSPVLVAANFGRRDAAVRVPVDHGVFGDLLAATHPDVRLRRDVLHLPAVRAGVVRLTG